MVKKMKNKIVIKVVSVMYLALALLIAFSINTSNIQAADNDIISLKPDKVYSQFDLDGDGEKDRISFKEHINPEWGTEMCDSFYLYVNNDEKLHINDTAYYKGSCSLSLFMFKGKYFLYAYLMGDDGDGPSDIYVYESGKFRKVMNINSFMKKVGYHTGGSVMAVSKNKVTLRFESMSTAVASVNMTGNFTYKNGKMSPISKVMKVVKYYNWDEYDKHPDLYNKDRQPYLTVERKIQLYKSYNKKNKAGIVNKGEKVKILKCYIDQNKVVYQLETKKGKVGWFSISEKSVVNGKYFKEVMYAG